MALAIGRRGIKWGYPRDIVGIWKWNGDIPGIKRRLTNSLAFLNELVSAVTINTGPGSSQMLSGSVGEDK